MTTATPAPRKRASRAKKAAPKMSDEDVRRNFHPLRHLIPDADIYLDSYAGRKVGGMDDLDVLERAFHYRHNVALSGPTGSAKTTVVYAFAAKYALPVVNIPCNKSMDPEQWFGGPGFDSDGTIRSFVPGDLTLCALFGGIANFDEANTMDPALQPAFHSLTDRRRSMTVKDAAGSGWCAVCANYNDTKRIAELEAKIRVAWVKDDPTIAEPILCEHCGAPFQSTHIKAAKTFMVTAAYNPSYRGTIDLNEAFKNRFAFHLDWGYRKDVEEQLLDSASLIEFAFDLRERTKRGDLRTPVPTNKLIEFEEFATDKSLGLTFAAENLLSYFEEGERQVVAEVLEAYAERIVNELQL